MAGATSNSTREAVEKAQKSLPVRGVDAILTASPYYNKPTQEGQYQHFKAIAEAVDKPLDALQRSRPHRAQSRARHFGRLAQIPNIIAVKEASGNINQIADIFQRVPESFLVFPATTRSRCPSWPLEAWV